MTELLGELPIHTPGAMGQWLLSRAVGEPPSTVGIEHKRLFGGYKTRRHPAWVFRHGSTSTYEFKDAPVTHSDIAITPAGQIYISGPMANWWALEELPLRGWVTGKVAFSGHALRLMADMLKLDRIQPPPPRPGTRA